MTEGSDRHVPHRRREDDTHRDRRLGPSRLSQWTERRVALLWLLWPGIVLTLVALAAAASIAMDHGLGEVRLALTRTNMILLAIVLLLPPACLTLLWWRMQGRRRGRRERS